MPGMYPVVARRRREHYRRILRPHFQVLVGRVPRDVGPVFRLVGIAVLRHPARAGEEMTVALHVEQWILNQDGVVQDRKSTRLNSSHSQISYAVFCLKKKTNVIQDMEEHLLDD